MGDDRESISVLHIDDEPDFVDMAAEFLEREDDRFQVDTAHGAEEGLELISDDGYDCIVSDYDMPGLDGIEVLETVRSNYPALPFILYTGKGSEEVASEAISAGVTDYLQKAGGTEQYALLAIRIRNAVQGYRAQRAIEESERQLRQVYERITDGFFAVNTAWEYIYVNEEGARLTDRSVDDLEGQIVWEAFPELLDSPFEDALRTAMETQETTTAEEYYPPHDSWYDVRVYGSEDGISIYFQDVTDRKEHEQALERERNRFSTLYDNFPEPTITYEFVNDEPVIRDVNNAFEDVMGYSLERAQGRSIDDLLVPPEKTEEAEEIDQRVKAGELVEGELSRQTADGLREFWFRNIRLPESSEADGFAVYADITERKEHERQLEATVEFLTQLYDVATNAELNAHEKISRLLQAGQENLDLPYGHLTRIEYEDEYDSGGTQTIIEASGDHELLQPGETSPLSRSYCRKTIETGGIFEVKDAVANGWEDDPAFEKFDLGSYIGTPVNVNNELYGTLFFASTTPREEAFSDAERTFVRLMSQLVSYELEQAPMT